MFTFLHHIILSSREHHVKRFSAAAAFYLISCLAPLLLFLVSIVTLVLKYSHIRFDIFSSLANLFGREVSEFLARNLVPWSPETNILLAGIGTLLALISATAVFRELKDGLDTIFEVPEQERIHKGILGKLGQFATFAAVLIVGLLITTSLLLSFFSSLALTKFQAYVFPTDTQLLEIINFFSSFIIITVLFMFLQRFVSSAKIAFFTTFLGSVATALLFTLTKTLFAFYLGVFGFTTSYGAASSLLVLLFWLYYSTQVFFWGAEITAYLHKKNPSA